MISSAADPEPGLSELAATGLLAAHVAGSPAMKQAIVIFNSGSTSLKFGAYKVDSASDPAAALSLLRADRTLSSRTRRASRWTRTNGVKAIRSTMQLL